MSARFRAWVFDLDNTLYPAEKTIYHAIGERMTAYIARTLACDDDQATEIRERYFHLYGATVAGLVKHHGVDAADFLDDVHQVDMSEIGHDEALRALIAALPGRKYIFTNGADSYGRAVAARLGLDALFDDIIGMDPANLAPKPQSAAFERLITRAEIDPRSAVFLDDHPRNLETAHAFGFHTVLVGDAPKPAFVDHAADDVKTALRALTG